MSQNDTLTEIPKLPKLPKLLPIVISNKPEGYVAVDWDIYLENNLTVSKVNLIVKRLLNYIRRYKFPDNNQTASLQYQLFKSVNDELLYNMKVFRKSQNKEVLHLSNVDINSELDQVPTAPPGPRVPKPPSGVQEITERSSVPS